MFELRQEDLPAGTVIEKVYRGEVLRVEVAARCQRPDRKKLSEPERRRRMWRYIFRGKRWRSLSAIAAEVTGDRYCSGNHFFGLRKKVSREERTD